MRAEPRGSALGRPGRRAALTRVCLLTAPLATCGALLLGAPSQSGVRAFALIVALCAAAVVVAGEWAPRCLTVRSVVVAGLVPVAVAVALAPQGSRDLWGYAAYGRVLVTYHESPYVHPPSEHAGDPVIGRMPAVWQHTRAPYGPAFLAVAGVPSAAGVRSALATRLWFQGLAGVAALLGLLLLARAGASPGRLAVFALNPLLAVFIVNGGHNDLLVGVPVLAAAAAVGGRRWVLAGVALGLAATVKVVALLPLVVLVAWVWRRHGRPAWTVAGTAGGFALGALVLAGGTAAVAPLGAEAAQQSRASLWEAISTWVLRSPRWFSGSSPAAGGLVHHWVPYSLAACAVAAVVLAGGARFGPATLVSLGLLAYLLAAPYVLPWYMGWLLPLLPLVEASAPDETVRIPSPLPTGELTVAVGAGYGAMLLLVYTDRAGYGGPGHLVLHTLGWLMAPLLELAALGALCAVLVRTHRDERRAEAVRSGLPWTKRRP